MLFKLWEFGTPVPVEGGVALADGVDNWSGFVITVRSSLYARMLIPLLRAVLVGSTGSLDWVPGVSAGAAARTCLELKERDCESPPDDMELENANP